MEPQAPTSAARPPFCVAELGAAVEESGVRRLHGARVMTRRQGRGERGGARPWAPRGLPYVREARLRARTSAAQPRWNPPLRGPARRTNAWLRRRRAGATATRAEIGRGSRRFAVG
jgi:hypothetical protein